MDDFDFVPTAPNMYNTSVAPKLNDYDRRKLKREPQRSQKPVKKFAFKPAVRNLIIVAAVVVSSIIALVMCYTIVELNSIIVTNTYEITKLQEKANEAKADNIRLTASLNAAMSVDKIQDYAVGTLGMQKAERYQIHYFEDRDGDKVVVADGKALNADKQGK